MLNVQCEIKGKLQNREALISFPSGIEVSDEKQLKIALVTMASSVGPHPTYSIIPSFHSNSTLPLPQAGCRTPGP
jgi:hypothetical protein